MGAAAPSDVHDFNKVRRIMSTFRHNASASTCVLQVSSTVRGQEAKRPSGLILAPADPQRAERRLTAPLMTQCDSSCGLSLAGGPDPEPQMATAERAGRSGRTRRRATTSPPER